MLYLSFFGITLAHQSLFDLPGRIFEYRQTGPLHGADRRAPGLAELECGIGIFMHEHLLYGHLFRTIQLDDLHQTVIDLFQSVRKIVRMGSDDAAGNISGTARRIVYHTVTGNPGARVYA